MRMNCSSAMSAARSLPSANERMPSASQYDAEHRDRFAHVFCRPSVHDRAVPGLDLPRALARRHDERRAAETLHASLERGERAQRRVQEQQAQDLAGERGRLGPVLQALGEREQVHDFVAGKFGQVEEALHGGGKRG